MAVPHQFKSSQWSISDFEHASIQLSFAASAAVIVKKLNANHTEAEWTVDEVTFLHVNRFNPQICKFPEDKKKLCCSLRLLYFLG